jgi:molybdate transport system substrate-binding protein
VADATEEEARMIRVILILAIILVSAPAAADEIRCAVAANFINCFEQIAADFEDSTGHTVVTSPGSTGRHYAQIKQGAPFDLFFAADVERPRLLEEEGVIVPGSRTTYARGELVLWCRNIEGPDLPTALADPSLEHLAIADPRLAPYGSAARQVLEHLGLWDDLEPRLVKGRSVGQAWHFVASGAADAGFVARSQTVDLGDEGLILSVPERLHDPIDQQVVLLNSDKPAARDLLDFVITGRGRAIIASHGYGAPAPETTP